MNVRKWRIYKRQGQWAVYAPGWVFSPSFTGQDFRHCVNALPYLQRIHENTRRLRRG